MTRSKTTLVLIVASVALWISIQIHSALTHTPTHDECWHLPVGLAIWQSGEFDQDRINPPLVRLAAALPYRVFGAEVDFSDARRDSDYARTFIASLTGDARTTYASGRFVVIVSSLIGILLLADLARSTFGPVAGLFVLLFSLTDPNIAAHTALVTHDGPAATAFIAMLWGLYRYLCDPSRRQAALVGVVFGLGLLAKFTVLVWTPVIVGVFVAPVFRKSPRTVKHGLADIAVSACAALLIVNAGYLFHGTGQSLSAYAFESNRMTSLTRMLGGAAGLPVPLPVDFVSGLDRLFHTVDAGHSAYLDREWELQGFRSYYFMCWLYKVPTVLQLASLVGMGAMLVQSRTDRVSRRILAISLPVIVLLVVSASLSGNQLGFRYVLPVYPFGILFAACGAALWFKHSPSPSKPKVAAAVAFVCLLSLRYHPHHLTYFNEIAGGPAHGGEHLLDSNIDWGQSLHALRDYLDDTGTELDSLAYFGTFPPEELGLTAPLPQTSLPVAGVHAVSINLVYGRPYVVRKADGSTVAVGVTEYLYFNTFTPITVLGNSIAVYEITEEDVAEYREVAQEVLGQMP